MPAYGGVLKTNVYYYTSFLGVFEIVRLPFGTEMSNFFFAKDLSYARGLISRDGVINEFEKIEEK